jgi:hypothetical protein
MGAPPSSSSLAVGPTSAITCRPAILPVYAGKVYAPPFVEVVVGSPASHRLLLLTSKQTVAPTIYPSMTFPDSVVGELAEGDELSPPHATKVPNNKLIVVKRNIVIVCTIVLFLKYL